jgi:hypothetical protein
MLLDRKLATSRSLRATGAAIRGAIFTFGFIKHPPYCVPEAARFHAAKTTIHHLYGDADHIEALKVDTSICWLENCTVMQCATRRADDEGDR